MSTSIRYAEILKRLTKIKARTKYEGRQEKWSYVNKTEARQKINAREAGE